MIEELKKLIDPLRTTIIVGDFNACYNENYNNRLIQWLVGMQFKQLVRDPTHIRGRLIDHAYILDPDSQFTTIVERY